MNFARVNRLYKITVMQDSKNNAVAQSLNNRMGAVAASTGKVTKNARGAALATRNLGYVAQNASYQIADFFVMMQGGVGVGRALATQLPQLLAGFGAFGAVLGAVAAIGASVVVMLQQQAKATKQNTEYVEKYGVEWEKFNDAQAEYLEEATYVNARLLDAAVYAERLAAVDLRKALQPPPVTGWDAVVGILGKALSTAKEVILTRFPIGRFFDDDQIGGAVAGALIEIQEANDAAARSFQSTLADLAASTRGTDEFFALLEQSGKELAALAENPALDRFIFAFTDLEQAEEQLRRLKEGLTEVLGENPSSWGDVWVERIGQLEAGVEQARATFKKFDDQVKALTTINPQTGFLEALTKRSPLEESINRINAAMDAQIILFDEGKRAIAGLIEIDRWEDLQDIIVDIGKSFEDNIINAMKTGKFAVKDFINFALEQFARLALSKVFEPFFLLLANAIPGLGGLGGTGSPSPSTGVNPLQFRAIEPPPSAAPMYNYGESISRIPGASRNLDGGSGNVTVNVNNYGKDEVEVRQANTDNGIEIDVLIKETVKQGFGGGDFDSSLATTFGLRRLGY